MKSLDIQLHKLYGKHRLIHTKEFKEKHKKMKQLLNQYAISMEGTEDTDLFLQEIIYTSLLAKRKFEDIFFEMYTSMYDYWYDLTYQQRKRFMNQALVDLKQELSSFQDGKQTIFFPCFTPFLNHLYTDELVLLDLKQYKAYIRNCAKEVNLSCYGVRMYDYGFCSAQCVAQNHTSFVLYHEIVNRFYLYKETTCVKELSLDPKQDRLSKQQITKLAFSLLYEDEKALLEAILQEEILGKKGQKKVVKYNQKVKKKVSE